MAQNKHPAPDCDACSARPQGGGQGISRFQHTGTEPWRKQRLPGGAVCRGCSLQAATGVIGLQRCWCALAITFVFWPDAQSSGGGHVKNLLKMRLQRAAHRAGWQWHMQNIVFSRCLQKHNLPTINYNHCSTINGPIQQSIHFYSCISTAFHKNWKN